MKKNVANSISDIDWQATTNFFFSEYEKKKKGFELEEKKRAFKKSGRYVRPFRLINPLIRSAHVLYVSPSSVTMIASFTYKSLDSLCWRFKYYIFFLRAAKRGMFISLASDFCRGLL